MKIDLQVCTELTTEEYCNLSERNVFTFEGQTRANNLGIYWIVWSNNEKLYKVKCSLNYFEPNNQASSQEEYDSNEEYYEQNLIIT